MKHAYIGNWQYNQADEEELEQIETLIDDLVLIAIRDLGIKSIKVINEAVRNLFAENYVNNSLSLQIFKAAIASPLMLDGAMQAHMQCYEEICEINALLC